MVVILVISFYFVKDYRQMWRSLVGLVPTDFQPDVYHLGKELTVLWNEFFRGRLLLCVIVGVMTFAVIRVIGIPNAFALSLIAGIGEFIPNVGPILATVPAVLVALFQADASWLGTMVGPVWLSLIVIGIYVVISQLENTILVPRVIGRSLNMHPIVVFIAALAGASVAGLLGILLAAPVLASGRVIFVYVYRKLNDLPPFPDLAQEGVLPAEDE
jgi:predicted PurR-regulated permease PerM